MNIAGTPNVFAIKKLRYAYTVFLTNHITILLVTSHVIYFAKKKEKKVLRRGGGCRHMIYDSTNKIFGYMPSKNPSKPDNSSIPFLLSVVWIIDCKLAK